MLKRLFNHEPFVPAYLAIAIGLGLILEKDSNHSAPAWDAPKELFSSFMDHPLTLWGALFLLVGILSILPLAKFRATRRSAPVLRVLGYALGCAVFIGYGATLFWLGAHDPKVSIIGGFLYCSVGIRFYQKVGKVHDEASVWPAERD